MRWSGVKKSEQSQQSQCNQNMTILVTPSMGVSTSLSSTIQQSISSLYCQKLLFEQTHSPSKINHGKVFQSGSSAFLTVSQTSLPRRIFEPSSIPILLFKVKTVYSARPGEMTYTVVCCHSHLSINLRGKR